jgi:hypothetical protein
MRQNFFYPLKTKIHVQILLQIIYFIIHRLSSDVSSLRIRHVIWFLSCAFNNHSVKHWSILACWNRALLERPQLNAPLSASAGSLLIRITSVTTGAGKRLDRPITRDPPIAGISQRKKAGLFPLYHRKMFQTPAMFLSHPLVHTETSNACSWNYMTFMRFSYV